MQVDRARIICGFSDTTSGFRPTQEQGELLPEAALVHVPGGRGCLRLSRQRQGGGLIGLQHLRSRQLLPFFQRRGGWVVEGYFPSAVEGEKPKLFVMGSQDQFTGIGAFMRKVELLPSTIEIVTMEGVDHFFWGKEKALCAVVQGWVEKVMGTQDLKSIFCVCCCCCCCGGGAREW